MLGRIKDTVGDVAETIKRAFSGPTVYSAMDFFKAAPACKILPLPTTRVLTNPLLSSSPSVSVLPLPVSASVSVLNVQFEARVLLETGEAFRADAKLVSIPLVWPVAAKSAKIPRMDDVAVNKVDEPYSVFNVQFYTLPRFLLEHGGVIHKQIAAINFPRCFASVATALSLPIRIKPDDSLLASKALRMRYSLQLVKKTGENIRNLEIIGLFRIPKKGVSSFKHDATTGLLWITAGTEAQKSRSCKLILARRKSDSKILSCILDDD